MNKLFFLLFINLLSYQLFSQFKEGYIITKTNDTIFGLIKYEGALINSRSCTFKKDNNSIDYMYTPEDISAFRFLKSKYYVSRYINIHNSYKKVFLEWLIKGKASILSYPISISSMQYYLVMDDDSLIELMNTIETKYIDNVKYIKEKHEYIGTLNMNFQDAGLQTKIMSTKYNNNSLINITKSYHNKVCKDENCTVFEDENRKVNYNIGFEILSINSTPTINSTYIDQNLITIKVPEAANTVRTVGFGISSNFSNLPLIPPNFSVQLNIGYYSLIYKYSLSTNAYHSYVGYDGYYVVKINSLRDTIFSYNAIRIPINIRYSFLFKWIQPYVSLGFSTLFRFNIKIPYPDLITHLTRYNMEIRKSILGFQYGINANMGFNFLITSKIGIDLGGSYEYLRGFFGGVDDKSSCTNYLMDFGFFYRL
jgi:hypothetical protein